MGNLYAFSGEFALKEITRELISAVCFCFPMSNYPSEKPATLKGENVLSKGRVRGGGGGGGGHILSF